jgi:acyl-CoA thioesterase I
MAYPRLTNKQPEKRRAGPGGGSPVLPRPAFSRWALAVAGALLLGARPAEAEPASPEAPAPGAVVFFGDSITAGYGLEPADAYPSLLVARLREAGFPHAVVNAGLSGETSAAGGRRAPWVLRRPVAVFVLALGGNDGLRGIPVDETARNLQAIIDTVRRLQPRARIILAGMEAPPNMGPEFTTGFRNIYPRLARESGVALVPFLLEGVGGVPELNQHDGIHPNAAGQKIVAENVWKVLLAVLRETETR